MKKGSFYFLSFLLICFSLNVFAQDDDKDVKTIALVPQYMLNNGIKVDFEFKLASEKQWINIAPQFYIDAEGNKEFDSGARDDFYDEMVGIGIDVSHKIFLTEKELPFGSYFGYGLTNQFFSLKYEGSVTEPYYENGLQYWRTVSKVANSSILKIGPNIFIGYQAEFKDLIFIDAYLGYGGRYSFHFSDFESPKEFNSVVWDYGHIGTLFIGGVRVGIVLK